MRAIITQVAFSVPFDNSTNGFTADEVQSAIEEAKSAAIANDRFTISCGFDGNASSGRYLEFQSNVDSNLVGWIVPTNCYIKEISVGVVSSSTVTFRVEKKDKTLLATVSLSSERIKVTNGLSVAISAGDEVIVYVTSGSCSRPIVFLNCQKG